MLEASNFMGSLQQVGIIHPALTLVVPPDFL